MSPPLFFCPAGASRRAGFTLIELLVATCLLSIVMSSVYAFTHASLRTWHYAEGGVDLHMEGRNALTTFSHEFNNIAGRAGHLFEGDDHEIVMFVIAQPMDLEQGEGRRLMRVIYSYNRNKKTIEREEALVKTALPNRPPNPEDFDRARVKLEREYKATVAENVSDLTFTYIWVPAPKSLNPEEPPVPEPPIYMDRHEELWGLPQGVRLAFTLTDPEDEERTYDMEVTLAMRGPTARMLREPLEEMIGVGEDE